MELGIKGKIAVVTASSKGLGRAVAEALAKEGVNLSICSRDKNRISKVEDELKNKYKVDVISFPCDLEDKKQIEDFVESTLKYFNKIDILFLNAGGPPPGGVFDVNADDYEKAINLNLMSAIRLTYLFLPSMIKNGWGRIIFSTSISVKQPIKTIALSNVSRAGIVAFSKTLSMEVAKHGITVNVVAPGYILTDRVKQLIEDKMKKENISFEEAKESITKNIPLGRAGKPEEFGSLVAFLSSEPAGYINGETILIDGGQYRGTF